MDKINPLSRYKNYERLVTSLETLSIARAVDSRGDAIPSIDVKKMVNIAVSLLKFYRAKSEVELEVEEFAIKKGGL